MTYVEKWPDPLGLPETTEELASWINEEHRRCEAAAQSAVEHALRAGAGLVRVKESLKHGEFLPWLAENFAGSTRTAQTYMKLARELPARLDGKSADSAHFGSIAGALKELAAPSSEGDLFYEVFEYIEAECRRLAAIEVETGPIETKDEHARKFIYHHRNAQSAMRSGGEHYLGALKEIRAIFERFDRGIAAGHLRQLLISMMHGPYGTAYHMALLMARMELLKKVADKDLMFRIEERMTNSHGPVMVDLADEETMLLKALAPELLEQVATSWEEDKDFELAMRKMEIFTRPCDIPPSRELEGYEKHLSEQQMQRTFASLRESGELQAADLARSEELQDAVRVRWGRYETTGGSKN